MFCESADFLALEMIASYGMAVGKEVFETCVWIGRFQQKWRWPAEVRFVYRQDVKLHLCGSPRAKDANIRQALLDMFPSTGGGKIDGGVSRRMTAGDVVIIPPNTAHWFSSIDSDDIVYLVVRVDPKKVLPAGYGAK